MPVGRKQANKQVLGQRAPGNKEIRRARISMFASFLHERRRRMFDRGEIGGLAFAQGRLLLARQRAALGTIFLTAQLSVVSNKTRPFPALLLQPVRSFAPLLLPKPLFRTQISGSFLPLGCFSTTLSHSLNHPPLETRCTVSWLVPSLPFLVHNSSPQFSPH